jgi:predicted Abi (CAAX) family protease
MGQFVGKTKLYGHLFRMLPGQLGEQFVILSFSGSQDYPLSRRVRHPLRNELRHQIETLLVGEPADHREKRPIGNVRQTHLAL